MGGFDDHVAFMGDSLPPNTSPRSIFTSIMGDNMVAGSVVEGKNEPLFNGRIDSENTDEIEGDGDVESRASSRGNLVERMAARAGFNAPKLNTESMRSPEIPKNSDGQSPFFMTIPPGLSPTTLLESPVFLHNSQIMPSPTTGKYSIPPSGNTSHLTPIMDKFRENSFQSSSFTFKPVADSGSLSYLNPKNKVYACDLGVQSFPGVIPIHVDDLDQKEGESNNENGTENSLCSVEEAASDQCCESSCDDDGYSWRKYGQKQVKGSENPRSYYKCTHENCNVKKKVKHSHEGDITEIVYNGKHNHPKPFTDRGGLSDTNQYDSGNFEWKKNAGPEPAIDVGEATSMPQEYNSNVGGLNASSTFSNDEDDERVMRGRVPSLAYHGEEDESDAKRRRHETSNYMGEMSVINRAIREPRVVVQTMSDVDILDDGYRWRKYGQKVVKGNPNPRSYYKCTSPGCNVRKHVERASHDLKSVITTYEGKHNHDVPAARNSSHANSAQQPHSMAVSSHIHRPELSQMLANNTCFRRPEIGAYGRPDISAGSMYGFGLNQPCLTNFGLPGLVPNQSKFPGLPLHPNSAMPKVEPITTESSGLLPPDGFSAYEQFMSRLPLGP